MAIDLLATGLLQESRKFRKYKMRVLKKNFTPQGDLGNTPLILDFCDVVKKQRVASNSSMFPMMLVTATIHRRQSLRVN
jgi:hypothetical protein